MAEVVTEAKLDLDIGGFSGAQIDIEEDGTVSIYASNGEAMELATREVQMISMDPEEGELYEGRVMGIVNRDDTSAEELGLMMAGVTTA